MFRRPRRLTHQLLTPIRTSSRWQLPCLLCFYFLCSRLSLPTPDLGGFALGLVFLYTFLCNSILIFLDACCTPSRGSGISLQATRTMDAPQGQTAAAQQEAQSTTYEAIHAKRDNESVRTASIDNTTTRNSATYADTGFSNVKGGIEVQRAEAAFAELSKELSRTSNISRRLSRAQSRQSRKDQAVADVEKTASSDASSDEPFDLESTLRGSRDEEEAAGIKSKLIGVSWDGLTVSGIGMYFSFSIHCNIC